MNKSIFEPDPQDTKAVQNMHMSPTLKLVLELGPLVIFFFSNYKGEWLLQNVSIFRHFDKPIFPATAIFMVAIVVALIASWIVSKKLPIMPLVSGLFVLIFGFLTLWLHDDTFIKMKPTIINVLFGIILFGGLYFKKSLLGYVLDSAFQLTAEGWRKLTYRWACFFIFLAVINELVWRNFSDEFWASFKVFGVMPITLIFMVAQMPMIMKYAITPLEKQKPERDD